MAAKGLPVEVCCRVLDVSVSGYYAMAHPALSARALGHAWLTEQTGPCIWPPVSLHAPAGPAGTFASTSRLSSPCGSEDVNRGVGECDRTSTTRAVASCDWALVATKPQVNALRTSDVQRLRSPLLYPLSYERVGASVSCPSLTRGDQWCPLMTTADHRCQGVGWSTGGADLEHADRALAAIMPTDAHR
jgi:hypothetical protein